MSKPKALNREKLRAFVLPIIPCAPAILYQGDGIKPVIGKPLNAKKAALLLKSGSPGVYDAAIAQFKAYMGYAGIEAAGVITSNGEENGSEAKLNEVREFVKGL